MDLTQIPFSTVRAALDRREAKWNERQTDSFNTSFHSHAEISSLLPDTHHVSPDLRTEHLGNWLPVIVPSQHIQQYHTIDLPGRCITALLAAEKSWQNTGRISASTMEDIVECFPPSAATYDSTGPLLASSNRDLAHLLSTSDTFVRLDFCSPKDGQGPAVPKSTEDVATKLVSSARACRSLQEVADTGPANKARLYLLPFRPEMDPDREYRVFCSPLRSGESRITAISQYRWHAPWQGGAYAGESLEQAAGRVLKGAEKLHESILRHGVLGEEGKEWVMANLLSEGFTFDVFDAGEDEVQLVEVNPFGAMSGCGSCLLHWLRDAEVLYGRKVRVEFRVALDNDVAG